MHVLQLWLLQRRAEKQPLQRTGWPRFGSGRTVSDVLAGHGGSCQAVQAVQAVQVVQVVRVRPSVREKTKT